MGKAKKISAIYALACGISMFVLWVFFILTHRFPDLSARPIASALLLIAEAAAAAVSLCAGIGLFKEKLWAPPVFFVSMGMVLYAVILACGQFAQRGSVVFTGMFAALAVSTVLIVLVAVREK
jgi:hypothetical protein